MVLGSDDVVPLTPTQRDLFWDAQLHPQASTFNIGVSLLLPEAVEAARWSEAVRRVTAAQNIMRTVFVAHGGHPQQGSRPGVPVWFAHHDEPAWGAQDVRRLIESEMAIPLDFSSGPLFKNILIRTRAGSIAAVVAPHIVFDGFSAQLYFEQIWQEYQDGGNRLAGEFLDFARRDFSAFDAPETRAFWAQRLERVVPLDVVRPLDRTARRGYQRLELNPATTTAVRDYAARAGLRLPAFFLGLYGLLLQHYADHAADWVVRVVVSGRPAEFRRTLGCFYHVVPYVFTTEAWKGAVSFAGRLQQLQAYRRELADRQQISVALLNSLLPGETLKPYFNFQTFVESQVFSARNFQVYMFHPDDELHLAVSDLGDTLALELYFNQAVFPDLRFLERLASLARQVVSTPCSEAQLDIVLDDERVPVAAAPAARLPAFRSVTSVFGEHARRQPDAVAVRDGERSLSYADCRTQSRRLVHALRACGVRRSTAVALCFSPSVELVAAILGVLTAGGMYVPLAPEHPDERRRFMLADAGVDVVVTQRCWAHLFSDLSVRLIYMDELAGLPAADTSAESEVVVGPDDAAYAIYTSGSTGQPKGVVVTHGNLMRLMESTQTLFGFHARDVWTLFHSATFDFSVWELWGAWYHGGCLVIVPETIRREPCAFWKLLHDAKVTVLNQTPAVFYHLISAALADPQPRPSLRYVILGGEALAFARLQPWFDCFGDQQPRLINMYGITETTVMVTWRPVTAADARAISGSLIGRPLPGWRVQILDRARRPVPWGLPGELCVGGAGVARGYLNRPELTAERFIHDPLSPMSQERLYRSGDRARWSPDGSDLEYRGRLDQQVKIRGYRIELGEIEAALHAFPGVLETVVIAGADPADPTTSRLLAYVAFRETAPDVIILRSYLRGRLPDYMVPACIIFLERLPRTPNGKVDRRALPPPSVDRPQLAHPYEEPRPTTEKALAEIWREVLGVSRVGRQADFFELGGHSLASMQTIARIRTTLGVYLPLNSLFAAPTLIALAAVVDAALKKANTHTPPLLRPGPRPEHIPLSFAQERVWFLQKMYPYLRAYEFHSTLRFAGVLDVAALQRALTEIIRRHEIFRTTFCEEHGLPRQVIHSPFAVALPEVDLRAVPPSRRTAEVQERIRQAAQAPYALGQLPLIRWLLIRLDDQEYILVHGEHHLVHDGWSFMVVLRELLTLYQAFAAQAPSPLREPAVQFADFVLWQRHWLQGAVLTELLAYWKRQLADAPVCLPLPLDRPRPARPGFQGTALRVELSSQETRALEDFSRRQGVTPFMTLLATFHALLARYTGADDIVVGTGVANRRTEAAEDVVGMVLNNVALRASLAGDPSCTELLQRVRHVVQAAFAHQDVPFEKVVEAVKPPRIPAHAPLFQVMFSSYDGAVPELQMPDLTVQLDEGLNNGSAKFDLNVMAISRSRQSGAVALRQVLLIWEYSTDLFDAASMERMLASYRRLLAHVIQHPELALSALPLLPPDEHAQALALGTRTARPYPRQSSLSQLFSEQVLRTPTAVAVTAADQELTYAELDGQANRLANHLRKQGVGPDVLVGLYLERSPQQIIAALAVLKAGGAFVPLEATYPVERLAVLLGDAAPILVLSQHALASRLPPVTPPVIWLDDLVAVLAAESFVAPANVCTADHLAYVMYTSGSTGTPKGVLVPQRGIVRLVKNTDYVDIQPSDVFLQAAPISFDASTFEVFGSLLNGARLVLAPPQVSSLADLGELIQREKVSILWLTAGLFQQMVDGPLDTLAGVRQLITGGDVVSAPHARRFLQCQPHTRLVNGYGPTESTTFACCHVLTHADEVGTTVPIGRPIANTQAFVLDDRCQPVPLGVAGELCLGGDGLARGYLKRPELTAASFVAHPFDSTPGARLYRTGDRVRWRNDGVIEFLGRQDDQVKIRGFRVELGEVETALRLCPDVHAAVVVARGATAGDKHLVAYVVPAAGAIITTDGLRQFLRTKLPEFMLPSVCMLLAQLPLTPHGKVDRQALPAPAAGAAVVTAPLQTPTEERLGEIWRTVLGVSSVGRYDNFFDMGGHSLLGLNLMARIHAEFGIALPLRVIFDAPTIADMAAQLSSAGGPTSLSLTRSVDKRLVTIQPGRPGHPALFIVPAGKGGEQEFTIYARVVRKLESAWPVYGFLARGRDGVEAPHRNLDAMVADYVDTLRKVQPHGPYTLVGDCLGGLAAHAMACRLRAAGETVAALVLMDTTFPAPREHRRRLWRRFNARVRSSLKNIAAAPLRARLAWTRLAVEDLACFVWGVWGPARANRWPDNARARDLHLHCVYHAYPATLLRHTGTLYPGTLDLVVSSDCNQAEAIEPWRRFAAGGLRVHAVAGNHQTYVRDEADFLGQTLARILAAAGVLR